LKADKYRIKNKNREIEPLSVGKDEPTRIVTNVGLTPEVTDVNTEYKKTIEAIKAESDIISDVSIDKNYRKLLEKIINNIKVPIATVPLYGTCIRSLINGHAFVNFSKNDILKEVEYQAKLGIDIMTFHAAITLNLLKDLKDSHRIIKIPSRGGSFIAAYMIKNNTENPLYNQFEDIIEILKEYNVTLSLGSSLRPGSIIDGLDSFYLRELQIQGELVRTALKKGVNVMVEGVGHLSLDMIPIAIKIQKILCHNIPLRPLPICTDRAAGHDNIAASIAAAVCALNGADILSVITKGEHIGLPRIEDIIEGVKSFKIAAHIADIVKINDIQEERKISEARKIKKWDNIFKSALYPLDSKYLHEVLSSSVYSEESCSMCGSLCALKIINKYLDRR
jgi:phosphomethylpyrimidine synthase